MPSLAALLNEKYKMKWQCKAKDYARKLAPLIQVEALKKNSGSTHPHHR